MSIETVKDFHARLPASRGQAKAAKLSEKGKGLTYKAIIANDQNLSTCYTKSETWYS